MVRVFVVNPGYSMRNAYDKWKHGDFPGQALYGVNHFEEYGCEPVFQKRDVQIGEKSRGTGGAFKSFPRNRLKAELTVTWEVLRDRDYDVIYLPSMNHGILLLFLHLLRIIRKPVVGVVHSAGYSSRIKHFVYKMCYHSLDKILFIAASIREDFDREFPRYRFKAETVILMSEMSDVRGSGSKAHGGVPAMIFA